MADDNSNAMLSHMVYFTLTDASAAACSHLVDQCHKFLKNHDGVEFFAAGTLVQELNRPVNDREFDVALNVVFRNKAAHDAYQVHDHHTTFIAENNANWKKVRVFDAFVRS